MEQLGTGHISRQFNEEIEHLRNRVLKMGGLVEQQVLRSIEALKNIDEKLAQKIIKKDHKVNAMEVKIDEESAQMLALRQPTASDLRMVVAVIKTITDLERIGDEAEKIAAMSVCISESGGKFHKRYADIKHLGKHVASMVHDVLDAFARLDVGAAIQVVRADEVADEEYQKLMRQLLTYMMEDPRTITVSMDIMWAARAFERIGDHAKNISEYIIYLVEGKDVRHIDIDEIEKDIFS